MKKFVALAMTTAFVATMVACAAPAAPAAPGAGGGAAAPAQPAAEGEVFNAIMASSNAPTHPIVMAKFHLAELLYEKSDGRIVVDVFHSAQLGSDRDIVEGMMLNTIQLGTPASAPLAAWTNAFTIFDLPFLFHSVEEGRMVVDSAFGDELLDSMVDQGVLGIAWYTQGMRHVTNNLRPVYSPEDLVGMRLRTMENPMHMDSFRAMGADAIPMAFGELFTALQQGALDAQENPIVNIRAQSMYEVQDFLSLTGHFYGPSPLLVSAQWFNGLPTEIQDIIFEATAEAQQWLRDLIAEMEEYQMNELREFGMAINEINDVEEFAAASISVHEQYVGDLVSEEAYATVLALLEEFRN
jgi:tripartite ATP-independent transporter DctP family solute receptor